MTKKKNLSVKEKENSVLLRQEYVVETVCRDLEREGYSVQPFVIPACAVGAPHRRDRVWFIAKQIAADGSDTGIETVQREREDGVLSDGAITNAEGKQSERFGFKQPETCEQKQVGLGRSSGKNYSDMATSDTDGTMQEWRLQQTEKRRNEPGIGAESLLCIKDWSDFPTTQPAIRRRDDGLPFDVHSLTIPFTRWRQEAIKAYGNSMVPQVVYEIFRAIEVDAVDG